MHKPGTIPGVKAVLCMVKSKMLLSKNQINHMIEKDIL
jgi:hypothetical protein